MNMPAIPNDRIAVIISRLALAAFLLGAWELAVRHGNIDDFWVSRPSAIGHTLWEFFATGYIFPHLFVTLEEAMLGLVAGSVGGILLGFLLARFEFFGRVVNPFIFFLYSIPRIALAPLFVLWFGIGLSSKIFTIFVIVFFLLLVNTVTGIRNVDPHLIRGLKAMGATRLQIARMVTLPSTLVWILAGLQIAIPNSVIGAVIGEYVGATRGLGYVILFASSNLDTTTLLAAITVLGTISVAISRATSYLEARLMRWRAAMPAV
jgi:NitT/TauT family transport system permease protein